MKRLPSILALATIALGVFSCGKNTDDYLAFVGTWGVERIEYYNTDFHGEQIQGSTISYEFTPGDTIDGIDLVFKSDRTGVMIDRSRDVLVTVHKDTIICPDTILISTFTFSYHKDDNTLYLNMKSGPDYAIYPFTYVMEIPSLTKNSFIYTNEYDDNYVEKAWLKRLSKEASATAKSRKNAKPEFRPRREGSLLSN